MSSEPERDPQIERQTRVHDALVSRSPRLAALYITALEYLATPAAAGREVVRVSVICHCMRELMNGLPSVMATSIRPRPNPSSASLTSQLPELAARHPGLDLRAEQDVVPVPAGFAVAIANLINAVTNERGIQVANAAALLTDGVDTTHPTIKEWKRTYAFFVEWTHLDRNPNGIRELPADDLLRASVQVIEDVIEVRTALFFENLSAVEDLLAIANAGQDEEQQ